MPDESQTPFRLGRWLVEPDLNRISAGVDEVRIEPKTMAVLVYLSRRPGEVISADEIITEVWGGRPMGDNPVYKCVAKLRRALGDAPGSPEFIATVPKKGYRMVGEVSAAVGAGNDAGGTLGEPLASLSTGRRVLLVAVGLLAGVAIAGVLFWRPPTAPASVRLISGFPGSHSQPSLAPDGEGFAFVSDASGVPQVWILEPDVPDPRQLTFGDSAAARPRWSPSGRTVLFMRRNSLWSVPAEGGEPIEVIRNAYHPNWSRDGAHIVFERRFEVWVADADGSGQRRVEGVPSRELPLAPRWPAFSPDGSSIVFFDSDATPQGDLWIIPAAGGEPEQITFAPAMGGAPAWSPDGKHIVYSSQRGGSRTLWRVDVASRSSRALLVGSGDDDFPAIADDGSRVIYTNSRQQFTVVESDPETGSERELYESRHVLVGPELSPDRETLAFFGAARTGGLQIFTLPLTATTPRLVTTDPLATHALPQWSGDGDAFYFFHTASATSFSKVSVDGGPVTPIVVGWNWNVANGARVDPEQTAIIYSRLTGQTPVQTLIRTLDGSDDRTFYATLEYPRWTSDGRLIAGSRSLDREFPGDVAVCPREGPACRILAEQARIPVWSHDGSEIFFVRGFGTSQDLFVVPSDGSADERYLMKMAPLFPLGPFYDVTNDGKVIWVRHEVGRSELWIADIPDG